MIFPQNCLRLFNKEHSFGMEFNALDALKLVDAEHDCVKVACAEEWRESRYCSQINFVDLWFALALLSSINRLQYVLVQFRKDTEHIKESAKPYDWTFSTDYKGTLLDSENARLMVWLRIHDSIILSSTSKITIAFDCFIKTERVQRTYITSNITLGWTNWRKNWYWEIESSGKDTVLSRHSAIRRWTEWQRYFNTKRENG